MKSLAIDIETRSSVDLSKSGVYPYAESEDFQILLFACSVDEGPVQIYDLLHGEVLPEEIQRSLADPSVTKWSYNSAFERICLSRYLGYPVGVYLPPEEWRCSMTWAATLGLPQSLKAVCEALRLEVRKLDEGKDLIRRYCVTPFVTPESDDPDWQLFMRYCERDVECENEVRRVLSPWPVPDGIWQEFWDSEMINDRGVRIDRQLAKNAIILSERENAMLSEKMQALTGLENPNSVSQLKAWLGDQGVKAERLDKDAVKELIRQRVENDPVSEVLRLRLLSAKTSVKKYQAMVSAVNSDGRVRGLFRFYGANRTGRFASRLIQLQNLPKNHMGGLERARELLRAGEFNAFRAEFPDVQDALSQLVRTAIIGNLLVADESAIEARVLAWLAREQWRMEAFAEGQDIYCASASQMFHVPVEKHGVNAELRPKGKVAELALGYQGGPNALIRMGALEMGLKESELLDIITAWRSASPNIVQFWYDMQNAAITAVKFHASVKSHGFVFSWERGILFITLLSGRRLAYWHARIERNEEDRECLTYLGYGADKKWQKMTTYGGRLTENIVQATARDVLCYALGNLRQAKVIAHVHDEILTEDNGSITLGDLCSVMGQTPPWAPGLLLKADGFASPFYKKEN